MGTYRKVHLPFLGIDRFTTPGDRPFAVQEIRLGGRVLAEAAHEDECLLFAEIDPEKARNKHHVRVPGKHEINRIADRRPEMDGKLVEPKKS